jgi:DNA-binding response OmpR family regulator
MNSTDEAWDGFSVVALLKRLSASKPPPIVVISGTPDTRDTMKKALEAGVYRYLAKPIEREMLLKVIAEALRSESS